MKEGSDFVFNPIWISILIPIFTLLINIWFQYVSNNNKRKNAIIELIYKDILIRDLPNITSTFCSDPNQKNLNDLNKKLQLFIKKTQIFKITNIQFYKSLYDAYENAQDSMFKLYKFVKSNNNERDNSESYNLQTKLCQNINEFYKIIYNSDFDKFE